MNGVFVTGTDTEIGKTMVSAVLISHLKESRPVIYWKPVQTGIESDDDTKTVSRLAGLHDGDIHADGIRLEKPLSPHLSARLAGTKFSVADIIETLPSEHSDAFWVVEGAGGVLVPLNDDELMIDLIEALRMPAVVVSRTGLGTINHTLLTVESLRSRNIDVSGVIMNGDANPENLKAIEKYGELKVLAQIPFVEPLSRESIAAEGRKMELPF
ncbi:MAG: dethiobiotin synthase [Pyrinomonadaceae bacterium]|nr:dethiobiotin synthase [Pyrinomonadaceae bacterium]